MGIYGEGGGATKRGGASEGNRESFSHPEAEAVKGTTSFGVVLTKVLEVLTILEGEGGGHKRFPP